MQTPRLADLYLYGFSIPEVSRLSGMSSSTVRSRLHDLGVLRSRAEGVRAAACEGRLGDGMRGKRRVFTQEHKDRIKAAKLAHGEIHAKGTSVKPNGYVVFTRGEHKGRSVHRVVAEQKEGRPLTRDEHAHHVDEVKTNNEPDNIEVMSASDHTSMHAKANARGRERNSDGTWR